MSATPPLSSDCRLASFRGHDARAARVGKPREATLDGGLLVTAIRRVTVDRDTYHPDSRATFALVAGTDDDLAALRGLGYQVEDRRENRDRS